MTPPATPTPIKSTLIDITKCIGCRACQVACKQWNDREGEETELQDQLGFQNPATLSAKTLTLITFHELPDESAPGGLHYLFTMRRCLHCLEPACASACPTTALFRQPDGPVTYDPDQCIGCRYCVWACPWGVPTAEWNPMTHDVWLSRHSYLQTVGQLHALVDSVAAGIPNEDPGVPIWDNYTADFREGVPLLESSAAVIDLIAAARVVVLLVEKLASVPLPDKVAQDTRALDSELRCDVNAPRRAVAWLLDKGVYASAFPGLLRYFGWTALARHLRPVVDAFAGWREEERWLRSYCPTCGSRPGMAQLVGTDPGRLRLLSCACCKTRWRYRRTGCPFCESQNIHRVAVLAVVGEGGLRIDYCESCRGYLKTYDGEGSENVLLADWTSIHLDIIARDRGLKRSAASLYEV